MYVCIMRECFSVGTSYGSWLGLTTLALGWYVTPAKDGSHQSLFFSHDHEGQVSKYSLMSTKDQYRSTH
jgi:hypothetical protein